MSRPFPSIVAGAAVLVSACAQLSMASRAILEKPYLSDELQQKLQNLPYGLSEERSLVVRFRHVDSVQFFGGGTLSRYSFKRGQSVMNEGISLRLLQNGKTNWANGVILFKKPIDASRYNSLVVWAWVSQPNLRVWIGMRGGAEAKSDALPIQGFPSNEPVQLVIPFSRFYPKKKVNLSAISQLTIEFGKESTGNIQTAAIQILGIAFVEQKVPLNRSMLVLGRVSSSVSLAEPLSSAIPENSSDDFLYEPIEPKGARTAGSPSAPGHLVDFVRSFISPAPSETPAETDPSSEESKPNLLFYPLFIACLAALWIFVSRYQRRRLAAEKIGKVFHEIHWPFSITQPVLHKKVEREFWKGVAVLQERFAWLSTTGLIIEKTSSREYFGEPFLRRQIQIAAKEGITLLPSLSFTNSVFRKDAMTPNLERSSTILRTLAIETIGRFAETAAGVRIENAVDQLSARLRRKAKGIIVEETDEAVEHEFWTDVIQAVRLKKPHFIFVADSVGDNARMIREVGFDYYENDRLVGTLHDQIREGKVGDLVAFLRGESAAHLKQSIYNLTPLLKPFPKKDLERYQHVMAALILTMLPGVIQHDNTIPEDLSGFIDRLGRTSTLNKGKFMLLKSTTPEVLSFARWRKKTLLICVANFSSAPKNALVGLTPLQEGFDNNKLYLFNNALHGASSLKNLINQPDSSGPALALWGQNLRDTGIPVSLPPLSLGLFSVNLTRPLTVLPSIAETAGTPLASAN